MKKLFAMSNVDGSFIVSAADEAALVGKINEIQEKYETYYKAYVAPGFSVVKADNLQAAKTKRVPNGGNG